MKKSLFIGVMVLGALLVVTAGISQAGGWMNKSGGETRSMEQGSNTTALEPGSNEYWQAQEAGTLPDSGVSPRSSESDEALNPRDDSEPKQQIGAFEYRDIDRGP